MEKLLYTRREAAIQLSISVPTLDRLIGLKKIGTRRVGRRVLVPHTEMLKFIKHDTLVI